ncbi:transposase [Chloroflexota bacterium]
MTCPPQTAPVLVLDWRIAEQTYSRWRKEYSGMRVEQAKRLKDLAKENSRHLPG